MDPVNLQSTATTPAITLTSEELSITGRSIPLSEANFYDPFIEWAKEAKSSAFHVIIRLEYMNSSSSKKLLHLLKTMDHNKDMESLKVTWYYEDGDEELMEHGLVFEKLLKKAEFRIVSYTD